MNENIPSSTNCLAKPISILNLSGVEMQSQLMAVLIFGFAYKSTRPRTCSALISFIID